MNHLQPERTVLSYHPGVNSCSSGSIEVWMPWCMYESLHYSCYDCRNPPPPLPPTHRHTISFLADGQSPHNQYGISALICNGNKTLEQNDSCIAMSFILWQKLENQTWFERSQKTMKNLKLVSPSQWIASYVARSSHGILVITLIYLLPFDNKL